MTFDEVLAQVLELLQREKRVSYRALKRRFDLDDEYLEDLKDEIIKAKRLAIDEEGTVLVWTGDIQTGASPPPQTPQQPTTQETQPTGEPPPTEYRTPEAERRQLTVMFCDLVDSTKLASQLDPEDYREVVRAYQATCTEVIHRYDGHIAQYLGDGLLVYFGYPVAHEEDAQRAIHSGLGIVEAIGALNIRLEQTKGIKLAVRLGIHTGLVVVGEMGGEGRQEQLALGEVPNVTSRIQGIAEANTLVISSATYRLIQGYFVCQGLGEQSLRGVAEPVVVYQVLRESGVQSRLDVASTRGLTPLVGREKEVGLLIERWEQAKEGQGQVMLLSGEAGIGKSRLVQVLKDHAANEPHTRWDCRSLPYYQNTALYPLIDLLQRALQWRQDDTPEEKLERLEQTLSQYRLSLEETIPLFAPLLSLSLPEDRYPPLHWTPQRQRQKTLEAILAVLLELAQQQPVLFILEDLHWTDPTTLELLGLLVEQVPAAAIYTLLTCRPHFHPSWSHRSYLTEITVNRLSRNQIAQMATQVAGRKMLPTEIIQQLVDKTDGVPLYVEEMTKAVVESGVLKETDNQYKLTGPISSLSIPATLQDSLMARLDRLVSAKGIAQLGATIGRQFSYELLQAVSQLDEMTLQRELGRLAEAELVYQRGLPPQATYTFKHALIQDAAYESLLKSTRQQYHQRIVQVLEEQFPETAETQPELLAHHHTQAGRYEQAIDYWQKAGQRAAERSANVEAIRHLTKGVELLTLLPETLHRTQQELDIQIALGRAVMASKGFAAPESERVHLRAQELCQQLGDTARLFSALYGLWRFYVTSCKLDTARATGEQLLSLAQRLNDPVLLVGSHAALGVTYTFLCELVRARSHAEHGIRLYDQHACDPSQFAYEPDPKITCLIYLAQVLVLLGYPDQAVQHIAQCLALTHGQNRLFGRVYALSYAASCYQWRREVQRVQELAEQAITLAQEHGFAQWLGHAQVRRGWACAMQGRYDEGKAAIEHGLTARATAGLSSARPRDLVLFAEVCGMTGRPAEGLRALAEAQTISGARSAEAELYRVKGELLLQQSWDNATEAETCFQQAMSIAQNQQAKSWELRAATSLARLWQRQGKREEARGLLGDVYNWFTEGFDTLDLKDAKALLGELSCTLR